MHNLRLSILFLLFFTFWGCAPSQSNKEDDNLSSRNIATYQILKTGQYPQDNGRYLDAPKEVLFYYSNKEEDIKAFEQEYFLLTGEEAPVFEGTALIAKMGTKNSGGYSYELVDIVPSANSIEVKILYKKPAEGEIVTMALTNPYIIILLPENYKEVIVTEVEE
jgi:hypothetical protein